MKVLAAFGIALRFGKSHQTYSELSLQGEMEMDESIGSLATLSISFRQDVLITMKPF